MTTRLKRLSEQVMVITGATSGIGLTTARKAAARGAKLVLAARDEAALRRLEEEFRRQGFEALGVPTDVGDRHAMEGLAQVALARFGRIDTWVNNAGVSIFGTNEEVAMEDHERLFQTNFWGVVYGSLEAVKHMRKDGGALINLGSELSDVSVPLQGMYAASKHAVKGFTDSLRMELEKEGAPVSVTLIKPAAIDTMFTVHAKNYMAREPKLPPPVYAPDLAADAILRAAEHPERDLFVGGAAKLTSFTGLNLPRLLDKYMEALMFKLQRSELPSATNRRDALHQADPSQELRERLGSEHAVHESCAYTRFSLRSHKPLTLALLGGGALLAAWQLAKHSQPAAAALPAPAPSTH
ncbi:SDR family oxidoreductase [Pseudoduganella namucuonensis]|uniref:Short-chain dehydrogenase n=1 Tax=Pseudoduganella namucuonensis TaxID=1035707 RepID=A0A1I7I2Z3_9BURK|nr:SDR family oxidoreductase [Pseudoduganella namucuonensis]SFU67333.1 Short-chain dehydrogenase [Pseudoduganella namucuonensis]